VLKKWNTILIKTNHHKTHKLSEWFKNANFCLIDKGRIDTHQWLLPIIYS